MIGVFDSGVGGLTAFDAVRRTLSREDMVYLADRKNLPYGKKTESELIPLVERGIGRLREMGCRRVLIACCTASSVHSELGESVRRISLPIIAPTAAATGGGRVTVIATERTVRSHAFKDEIMKLYPDSEVCEIEAQSLVSLVEDGCRDGSIMPRGEGIINEIVMKISDTEPRVLVLGCTHFSHLEGCFSAALPRVRIVNSAREGARALLSRIKEKNERGIVRYTE